MSDTELVIKIPEKVYNDIKEGYYDKNLRKMAIAIGNGAPLPKGHGAIIDVKDIEKIHIVDNGELTLYKLGTDVEAYIYATPLVKPDEENK